MSKTKSFDYQRLDNRSRMSREVHVRFCKGLRVKFPHPTRLVIHGKSKRQAELVLTNIAKRFSEVGLELHPTKTKIVYCKDENRIKDYENVQCTF
jgi:ribosomal protein L6P/L9E